MTKQQLVSVIFSLCLTACSVTASETTPPKEYLVWLEDLKQEMADRGISQKTLQAAFAKNYYHPQHSAVKKDRNQTEFVLTTGDYLQRVVAPLRVKQGQKFYNELKKRYPQGVSGVPTEYLTAFWGIETNYGTNKGGYSAIEALTVLSYDPRRSKFFREELYQALKILDKDYITVDKMESSWAGAMGHFQFMPSTLNAYGVDADADGKIDIWKNFDDALFSAGNYLSGMGWKSGEPWGIPVDLTWDFDYINSGRDVVKSVKEWKTLGVQVKNIDDNLKAALIVPEGHRGQAYLIFDNFHIIMRWNRSENYALAVGMLADRVKNPNLPDVSAVSGYRLTKDDIKTLQRFINQQRIAQIDEDGLLGSKTRQALQKLQQRFNLPADGYPDYRLLKVVADFPQNGYSPAVPSQKLHRGK